jgi:outer membrane lipopolysaccharide assembly protein LptE/RlpB
MISILRLVTGEDIIGNVTKELDYDHQYNYKVESPMVVTIAYNGKESVMQLQHWLPVQLLKANVSVIKDKDIITMVEPNEVFATYYSETAMKLKKILATEEELHKLEEEMRNMEINNMIAKLDSLDLDNYPKQ